LRKSVEDGGLGIVWIARLLHYLLKGDRRGNLAYLVEIFVENL